MKKNRRKKSQDQISTSSSSDPPPAPAVVPPPLEWEEQSQCLGPIFRNNSVPLVVTCDKSCLPSIDHVNFDFTQPLLLHTRRTVRKVLASNVVYVQNDKDSKLKNVGDRLLIPEDYKGWFAVLGSPREVRPQNVIPHFRQVAQLALSKCESFLIGGNQPIRAVQMPPTGAGADSQAQPRLLYPGDVLRMGKLYVGESIVKVKKPLFGGKRTVKKEEKFLLCTDDNDRDLYLPVESRGTFYMLTTEGNGSPKIPIMRMKDICTHFRFPCLIKLLFGRVPSTPCSFTGTLMLRDSQIESSVIGCTMLNLRNILLDLPVDTDLKFFVARSTPELISSQVYKNAKVLCQDKASTYMRNMKVAYYVSSEDDDLPADSQEERTGEAHAHKATASSDSAPMLSKPRPSIVEDQELFCPPETTPKSPVTSPPTQNFKKSKKSGHNADENLQGESTTSTSPPVLRKDQTFNLPEPRESLPLRPTISPSVSVEKRPLPPIVSPTQRPEEIPTNDHYMSMDDNGGTWSGPKDFKLSTVGKAPPPTPPKPDRLKSHGHSNNDGCLYAQIWNGEAKVISSAESHREGAVAEPPPIPRPKRPDVPRNFCKISSIAVADTYLTLPVFKNPGGSCTTPSNESVSPSESACADSQAAYCNTGSVSRQNCDKTIYDVPSSLPVAAKKRPNPSGANDQPYETMTKTTSGGMDSANDQRPPTPPPKTRLPSSLSLSSESGSPKGKELPPPPVPDTATRPPDIVFENPSWMFSETSSTQSCEYASRWLSSHYNRPPRDPSDPAYVQMQRDTFTYYEGYDPISEPCPKVNGDSLGADVKDSSFYENSEANSEQTERKQTLAEEESEAVYANIQNLRLCPERLSISRSTSDISDDSHAHFLDKLANPPTVFGYVKAPPPRPVTPKKPPPLPKKPSSEKMVIPEEGTNAGASFQPGCSGEENSRIPLPPMPCKTGHPFSLTYLHPCTSSDDTQHNAQLGDHTNNNAAPSRQTRITSCYSNNSQQSSEDDLPLGATFVNFLTRTSDSGCALDSVVESREARGRGDETDLSSLSVADLGDALKNVGLTKETVAILRQEKVDGKLLASLDEEELKETLSGIKKLDIKKIQMFVNGWRPRE